METDKKISNNDHQANTESGRMLLSYHSFFFGEEIVSLHSLINTNLAAI